MSKNRVLRKQKMDLLLPQSKSLDNLRPSISVTDDDDASAEALVAAGRQRRGVNLLSASTNKLRDSSPRWKQHYAGVSSKWGAIASGKSSPWEDIEKKRQAGGYPWTHLSHDSDAEVWLDPVALPRDISKATMRRKDPSIPREWFHLPKGAEPPTVEQLMRDSSPDDDNRRAKSPPICGRARSKSREPKKYLDDGGYEPVGVANQMVPKKAFVNGQEVKLIPPRKAVTALPSPPTVDRSTKPVQPRCEDDWEANRRNVDGYEPVGQPPPTAKKKEEVAGMYAKVDMEAKAKGQEDKKKEKEERQRQEKEAKEREKREKEEKLRKEKEAKDREKREKEEKLKKEKEAKEREKREKEEKAKREKEAKEREKKEKEEKLKLEKENKEKLKKEKELEKERLKQQKEEQLRLEKENKERLKKEKEEQQKLLKMEKERQKQEKERAETELKERQKQELQSKEQHLKLEKERAETEAKLLEKEARERQRIENEEQQRKEREAKERLKLEKEMLAKEAEERLRLEEQQRLDTAEQYYPKYSEVPVNGDDQEAYDHEQNGWMDEEELRRREEEERQEIRLMLSQDQGNFLNDDEFWFDQQFEQSNNLQVAQMGVLPEPETVQMPPMSKKEKKKMEKELKAQRKAEAKEQKKMEKERKKQERKEVKMHAKMEKEEEKRKKKEAKERAKEADQETTDGGKEIKAKEEPVEKKTHVSRKDQQKKAAEKPAFQMPDMKAKLANIHLPTGTDIKDSLNKSMTQQLAVRTRVEEVDTQKAREMLTKMKTPAQLANLNHPFDIPMPKIKLPAKRSASAHAEDGDKTSNAKFDIHATLPKSWREANIVTSNRVTEADDEVRKRQDLVKTKTPAQLAEFHSISDIPIPSKVKSLLSPSERKIVAQKQRKLSLASIRTEDKRPWTAKLGDLMKSQEPSLKPSKSETTLGTSWRNQKLVTNVKVHADKEEMIRRRNLASSKSPAELARINNLGDIPIPTTLRRMVKRSHSMTSLPKKLSEAKIEAKNVESWTLAKSMNSQCLVRSKKEDPTVQAMRADVVKNKTVAELSQITSLSEIPIPSTLQNLLSKPRTITLADGESNTRPTTPGETMLSPRGFYNSLPRSLKTEVLVRSKVEDRDIQEARAEAIKAKSVSELSQIRSIDDIPLPTTIEQYIGRTGTRPVERRKRFREKQRSMSMKSLQDKLDTIKGEKILVVSKFEDPAVLKERREMAQSRSVSQLSQISTISDIPIPGTLERLIKSDKLALGKLKKAKSGEIGGGSKPKDYSQFSPMVIHDTIYSTLPRSMKSELRVKSKVQSPDVIEARRILVQSKSVGELSKVNNLSDIPVPSPIQTLWQASKRRRMADDDDASSYLTGLSSRMGGNYDIYSTLPSSMRREVLVRSKIETDYDTLMKRKALVQAKSPSELSQISALSEIPIPRKIEDWLQQASRPRSEAVISRSIRDMSPQKVLPGALTKTCIVRSKVEDPTILHERQQLILSHSPHELSKIRNLNEMPHPIKRLQLPDIPLPSTKYMFRSPRRVRGVDEASQTVESSFEGFTPASTPRLLEGTFSEESEALRFEMSSPESALLLPRDTDFGYEIIVGGDIKTGQKTEEDGDDETSSVSVADHYRGTPPLKAKKKRMTTPSSRSDRSDKLPPPPSDDELPPPLPPKKHQREASLEAEESFHSLHTDDSHIQSRPLPTPPTPRIRKSNPQAGGEDDDEDDTTLGGSEKFHSLRSNHTARTSMTLVGPQEDQAVDETLAESIVDSMHTCLDTLPADDNTLNEDALESDDEEFMAEMLPQDS